MLIHRTSFIERFLGIAGWDELEPVLLAALSSEEPLLLVGSHGTAKSLLLERLATVLGLEFRHYNASLLNYDDLVGFPMPTEDRRALRFISTPAAIWGAEAVFLDEISRTRPDLANKLFPIVHEKRIQGIELTGLRYRWAAMNPPRVWRFEDDDSPQEEYTGSVALDPALADRFSFVVRVPGWFELDVVDRRKLIESGDAPSEDPVGLRSLVTEARIRKAIHTEAAPEYLTDHFLSLSEHLSAKGVHFSPRRWATLRRIAIAIHGAREALVNFESNAPNETLDWGDSLLLAVQCGDPRLPSGQPVDQEAILAAHHQVWEVSRMADDDPWKRILSTDDPLERFIAAVSVAERIDVQDLSQELLDAYGRIEERWQALTAGYLAYLSLHRRVDLPLTAVETMAMSLREIINLDQSGLRQEQGPDIKPIHRSIAAKAAATGIKDEDRFRTALLNHLVAMDLLELGDQPQRIVALFARLWSEMGLDEAYAENTESHEREVAA